MWIHHAMMSSTGSTESKTKMYNFMEGRRENRHLISKSWKPMKSPGLAVFTVVTIFISTVQCANGDNQPFIPSVALQSSTIAPSLLSNQPLQSSGAVEGINDANVLPKPRSTECDNGKTIDGKFTVKCTSYSEIPTDIKNPDQVKALDMHEGNNALQVLKRGSLKNSKLSSLLSLNLQNCQIRDIEEGAFSGENSIITINLKSNKISVLNPDVFEGLFNLKHLYLSSNSIHRIESGKIFPGLSGLTILELNDNKLDALPANLFDNLGNLQKLEISNNNLKTLNWKMFLSTTRLVDLYLGNNPWHCDCQIKFLMDTLEDRSLSVVFEQATCNSTGSVLPGRSNSNESWNSAKDLMSCDAKITELVYQSHDVHRSIDAPQQEEHDDKGKVKLGQDVYLECFYSGYPEPQIAWLKDDKPIQKTGQNGSFKTRRAVRSISESNDGVKNISNPVDKVISKAGDEPPAPTPVKTTSEEQLQPKIHSQDGIKQTEDKNNYEYKSLLIVRRVEAKDKGTYECVARQQYLVAQKSVFLNVTVTGDDIILGAIGGNKKTAVWMWILIALLCVLILVLICLVAILIWRRKEKRKQEGFRKVVKDKFKDSNIDLGDFDIKTSSPHSQQSKSTSRIDGATPLLDNGSETSTVLISDHQHLRQKAHPLPDVALGNVELIRNSQIFSPKPPPALHGYPGDARKEFFARQISEPFLRPASAMSLSRPAALNASQRRYIYANNQLAYQSEPVPMEQNENLYAVPSQMRTLPRSGSAMSMSALPEHDLRRQMFMRQQSNPYSHYGTSSRVPSRRIPSTSSEPPHEYIMASYNYSTLPRRPVRLQNWSRPVSPTNSTCSTYSTLSWRPVDPNGVISDGVGVRKGACGGSQTSINLLPDMNGSVIGYTVGDEGGIDSMNRGMVTPVSGGGKVKTLPVSRNPRYGHNRTPSSMTRGHNDFFSFEPIQEVESSECASTQHLDRAGGGRQTPTGYTTQSLARGEPRYKKKKPPPIKMIPTNLKTPSRAFEHLKGRSVSPALRNVVNGEEPKLELDTSAAASVPIYKSTENNASNDTNNLSVPVLESPIDEEMVSAPAKAVPPPPPPKPKRSQNAEEENNAAGDTTSQEVDSQKINPVGNSDGTLKN